MAIATLLNKPKTNIIFMIAIVISSTLLIVAANANGNEDGAAVKLVVTWLPLMLAVATLLLYRISLRLFKRYNWIITLLGGLYILSSSLQFYLT